MPTVQRSILRLRFAGVMLAALAICHASSVPACATETLAAHTDPFAGILLVLGVITVATLVGRWASIRAGQPAVLGELLIGVAVGNIGYWIGIPFFVLMMLGNMEPLFSHIWSSGLSLTETARQVFSPAELSPGGPAHRLLELLTGPNGSELVTMGFAVWLFSNLGVILLLLMVGLESNLEELLNVGGQALNVALVGVFVPVALGIGTGWVVLPGGSIIVDLFLGAALCATSVGITARVFRDLGRLKTPEAKVILGAAIIDDILGLIVLAVCTGIVVSGRVSMLDVLRITLFSVVFLGTVIVFGDRIVRRLAHAAMRLDPRNVKLLFPLALACFLSWLASAIGLATIVGAFAAGLVLNEAHFPNHSPGEKGAGRMEALVAPLEAFFAPVFFVLMGMQVNLQAFARPGTLGLATALIVVAIGGKLVAGLAAGRRLDRLSIGIGMVPRGEVGLIFASIGKSLGVLNDVLFSAIVMMVIVTTMATPLALRWSLERRRAAT